MVQSLSSHPWNTDPAVRRAVAYAENHLSKIERASGETYALHGIEVASALAEVSNDPVLLSVAVLHDLPMHPDGESALRDAPLTDEQRELVRGMHRLRRLHIDMNTHDLDKMISAFAEDSRLLLLRMAHRVNDVRHLDRFNTTRQKEIAHETLYMYTAVSGRLGFNRWRWQMEDICFMELQPRIAKKIAKRFTEMYEMDQTCLAHMRTFLRKILKENGIDADIDERIKGVYSTYRKMVLKNRTFEELTDRLALRVLVANEDDCYRALGIIHRNMRAMPGKLKDYIGVPKPNGYRSIHTVVFPLQGISELAIEIQIRTLDMHREGEFGIASHGNYKHWLYMLNSSQSRANLFRNLESLHGVIRSQRTFTQALRHSFNDNKLLVFDPQNNLYHLPRKSTALDFVRHSGETSPEGMCVRINGRERPLDTPLSDGDTVEMVKAVTQ